MRMEYKTDVLQEQSTITQLSFSAIEILRLHVICQNLNFPNLILEYVIISSYNPQIISQKHFYSCPISWGTFIRYFIF